MTTAPNPYRGFRFPAEVISLSLRNVETIFAARGVVVSYESIRDWGLPLRAVVRQRVEAAPTKAGRQVVSR